MGKYASFAAKDMREAGSLWEGIGIISSFQFTNEPPDNYEVGGTPLFAKVGIVADGDGPVEERTQSQSYSLGSKAGEEFTVSPDGYGLVPINAEIASGRKGTKFDIFVRSAEREGLPESVLADGDFSKLIGLKANFKRVNDPERTFNNDGPNKRKESKFKPQTLVVVKVLGLPGEKAAATTTAATTSASAPAGASEVAVGDLDTVTSEFLQEVLKAAKDNRVQRSQLTLALNKVAMKHPQRQDIARRGADETFLATLNELGIVGYDPSAKPQYVTLAS